MLHAFVVVKVDDEEVVAPAMVAFVDVVVAARFVVVDIGTAVVVARFVVVAGFVDVDVVVIAGQVDVSAKTKILFFKIKHKQINFFCITKCSRNKLI